MSTKAQHTPEYERLRLLLRSLREAAGLTQRDLGQRLNRPQSWVHNCETGNRRVDVTEFVSWARACGVAPLEPFRRLVEDLDGIGDEGDSTGGEGPATPS